MTTNTNGNTQGENPPTESTVGPSGLSKEKEKELKLKIRKSAKWETAIGTISAICGIAAFVQSQMYTSTCLSHYNSYGYYYCQLWRHYPIYGIGFWNSVLTIVAGSLGICGTSLIKSFQKQRLNWHLILCVIALIAEIIATCFAIVACSERYLTFYDDDFFLALMIIITITGAVKILLLGSSIRFCHLLLKPCGACQLIPSTTNMYGTTTLYNHQQYPQGAMVVQAPGQVYVQPQQTMMMTPQGPMMMQPGVMYQGIQPGMQPMMQPAGMMMQPGMMAQPGMMVQPAFVQPGTMVQAQPATVVPPPVMSTQQANAGVAPTTTGATPSYPVQQGYPTQPQPVSQDKPESNPPPYNGP